MIVPASVPAGAPVRVQRVAEQWPVVHLEAEVPVWPGLVIDGLVRHPRALGLGELAELGASDHERDFHCVWGWSKRGVRWRGVRLAALLDLAMAEAGADAHVVVSSASGTYSACLRADDAASGLLAWARDGASLAPEHGGPLRFVGPPGFWGYKDVKWASRVTVVDAFRAGFWEAKVGDPVGRIPIDEVALP